MIAIAATDINWAIGNEGNLLFRIPADMKMFNKITTDHGVVVMGRKTFESIGKLLPGRINIILSSTGIDYQPTEEEKEIEYYCFPSLENVMMFIKEHNLYYKTCIIGGGTIYNLFLDYCSRAFITRVEKRFKEVDTYFPDLDSNDKWSLIDKSSLKSCSYNNLLYNFNEYINFSPKQI